MKLIKRSAVALLILLLLLFIMIKDVQQGQKHYTETHPAWETPVYNGNISLYKKGQTLFSALSRYKGSKKLCLSSLLYSSQ
ncbi:hypothetical protein [Priestia endophytica]|uniref:hypothetical protein n=1 Tax=Priestia endophytica TaxID=135735 RepID=UPI000DCA891A|nr:hypothetical protein [Priestia endophytica]RAS80474.1 hypothetical protein A4U60_17595 [Priestia endophytica]